MPHLGRGQRVLHRRTVVPRPVIIVGARVAPHLLAVPFVQEMVVAPIGVWLDLDRALAVEDQLFHALERIVRHQLMEAGDIERAIGVGTIERPEIGEARHHAAEIGAGTAIGPELLDSEAPAPGDLHRKQIFGGMDRYVGER